MSDVPHGPEAAETPEVDTDALMAEIRAAAEARRGGGAYSAEFLDLLGEPLDIDPDPAFAAGPAWESAVATARITAERPLESLRAGLGPAVVRAKRLMQRTLRWYLPPITDDISTHNQAVLDVLAEHNRRISELQREVELLRQRSRE